MVSSGPKEPVSRGVGLVRVRVLERSPRSPLEVAAAEIGSDSEMSTTGLAGFTYEVGNNCLVASKVGNNCLVAAALGPTIQGGRLTGAGRPASNPREALASTRAAAENA